MTPNLFLLGAGKCGTTTVHHALSLIPDVHTCKPKEPSFFCSYFNVVGDPISYFNLFDSPARWRCDASHVYFSNPETPPVLKALFPEARFILILRDPVERAFSLFRHNRRLFHRDGRPFELAETFEEALECEDARLADPAFPRTCRQYLWNFAYAESSRFDVQIRRYFDLYPRERFHIATLDELKADPFAYAQSVAGFLDVGLPDGFAYAPKNLSEGGAQMSAKCRAYLEDRLSGVRERTDALAGRPLDWSRG